MKLHWEQVLGFLSQKVDTDHCHEFCLLTFFPSFVFLIAIIKKPHLLIISNPFLKKSNNQSLEDRYNAKKVDKQSEIDKLLDKINKNGYENLSEKDRERLKKLTK